MIFRIYGRGEALRFASSVPEPHLWISIFGTGDTAVELAPNPHRVETLYQKYDDITHNGQPFDARWNKAFQLLLMSEAQAKEVVDLVEKHKDQVSMIVCQCEAGISRSAGTALALSLWLNEGDNQGIGSKWCYVPNMHVKRLILGEVGERKRNKIS